MDVSDDDSDSSDYAPPRGSYSDAGSVFATARSSDDSSSSGEDGDGDDDENESLAIVKKKRKRFARVLQADDSEVDWLPPAPPSSPPPPSIDFETGRAVRAPLDFASEEFGNSAALFRRRAWCVRLLGSRDVRIVFRGSTTRGEATKRLRQLVKPVRFKCKPTLKALKGRSTGVVGRISWNKDGDPPSVTGGTPTVRRLLALALASPCHSVAGGVDDASFLSALVDLQTPVKAVFGAPLIRCVFRAVRKDVPSSEGGADLPPLDFDETTGLFSCAYRVHVYATRLLFYLIAFEPVRVVMEGLSGVGGTNGSRSETSSNTTTSSGGGRGIYYNDKADNKMRGNSAYVVTPVADPDAGLRRRSFTSPHAPRADGTVPHSALSSSSSSSSSSPFTLPGLLRRHEHAGYEEAAQPADILLPMKPYQLQTLRWMQRREAGLPVERASSEDEIYYYDKSDRDKAKARQRARIRAAEAAVATGSGSGTGNGKGKSKSKIRSRSGKRKASELDGAGERERAPLIGGVNSMFWERWRWGDG